MSLWASIFLWWSWIVSSIVCIRKSDGRAAGIHGQVCWTPLWTFIRRGSLALEGVPSVFASPGRSLTGKASQTRFCLNQAAAAPSASLYAGLAEFSSRIHILKRWVCWCMYKSQGGRQRWASTSLPNTSCVPGAECNLSHGVVSSGPRLGENEWASSKHPGHPWKSDMAWVEVKSVVVWQFLIHFLNFDVWQLCLMTQRN